VFYNVTSSYRENTIRIRNIAYNACDIVHNIHNTHDNDGRLDNMIYYRAGERLYTRHRRWFVFVLHPSHRTLVYLFSVNRDTIAYIIIIIVITFSTVREHK